MIGKQGVSLLIGHNGIQDKTALNAANETVARGIYDATTLSAVDADLAVGNIKQGTTIFGKLGTLPAGGVETIDKYADAVIANNATYTIATSGIFACETRADYDFHWYSDDDTVWYERGSAFRYISLIADGTNVRIKNRSGGNAEYCIFRHVMSTGTYERYRDAAIAQAAIFTPSDSGFYQGKMWDAATKVEVNYTTDGWQEIKLDDALMVRLLIGDGTNLRFRENNVGAGQLLIFRAVMT